jgi:hypothetical protein
MCEKRAPTSSIAYAKFIGAGGIRGVTNRIRTSPPDPQHAVKDGAASPASRRRPRAVMRRYAIDENELTDAAAAEREEQ